MIDALGTNSCSIPSNLATNAIQEVEELPVGAPRTLVIAAHQDKDALVLTFEDSGEARQAYLDKRDPDWKWR